MIFYRYLFVFVHFWKPELEQMVGKDLVGPSNPVNPTNPEILLTTGMLANSQLALFSFFILFSQVTTAGEEGRINILLPRSSESRVHRNCTAEQKVKTTCVR